MNDNHYDRMNGVRRSHSGRAAVADLCPFLAENRCVEECFLAEEIMLSSVCRSTSKGLSFGQEHDEFDDVDKKKPSRGRICRREEQQSFVERGE